MVIRLEDLADGAVLLEPLKQVPAIGVNYIYVRSMHTSYCICIIYVARPTVQSS